ncbi:MAG TPA: MBOAT family O-acyltransferase [Polyangiaceae bacterium]|nr:MBOAT family O-acyltransferase [Polyangiaceae bacterium]
MSLHQLLRELLRFDPKAPLLFTGGQFLFWLTLFMPGLALLRRLPHARLLYLTAFSCFFYYKCSGLLLGALLFTATADYLIAGRIAQSGSARARRRWLWLSIALSGGLLAYFKYAGWLLASVDWVAPAGISFYTFESISYVVDVYRGESKPAKSWLEYLAYLAYFPHLMAGPIMRASQLLPSLRRAPTGSDRASAGLFLLLSGLFKKAIVADYLARYADSVFAGGAGLSGLELLLGVYAYAAQIYCDFAGYSEMALGLGRITGVELPVNFNGPYAATSLSDFWRRWHITLSTWLRDYVYVPLGGNRRGRARTALNLLLTMAFGGLWHGASLTFLVWGVLHGLLLCAEKSLAAPLGRLRATRAGRACAWLVTFHLVALLWVPFRAGSLTEAASLLNRIACDFQLSHALSALQARSTLLAALALGLLLGATSLEPFERWAQRFGRAPLLLQAGAALATIQLTLELRSVDVAPFIYFQF